MFNNIKKNLCEKRTTLPGIVLFLGGIVSVFLGKSTWVESAGIITLGITLMGCSVKNK